MLKKVNGKLWFTAAPPSSESSPPLPSSQHDQRAGRLELRLQPELCVAVIVCDVDPETAILTQYYESGAMVRRLGEGGGGGGERGRVSGCVSERASVCEWVGVSERVCEWVCE